MARTQMSIRKYRLSDFTTRDKYHISQICIEMHDNVKKVKREHDKVAMENNFDFENTKFTNEEKQILKGK